MVVDDTDGGTATRSTIIIIGGSTNMRLLQRIAAMRELGANITIANNDDSSTQRYTGANPTTMVMDEWHRFTIRDKPPLLNEKALKIKQNQGIDLQAQKQARRTLQAQQKHRITGNCRRR
jgi:hypothetical protein